MKYLIVGTGVQKDMKPGKQSEMDGLVFEIMRTAAKFRLNLPVYRMISTHFGYSS